MVEFTSICWLAFVDRCFHNFLAILGAALDLMDTNIEERNTWRHLNSLQDTHPIRLPIQLELITITKSFMVE